MEEKDKEVGGGDSDNVLLNAGKQLSLSYAYFATKANKQRDSLITKSCRKILLEKEKAPSSITKAEEEEE
jgi:hypothetical protein